MTARVLLLGLVLLLSGCRVELYSNLSELEANQMLALLMSNRISAEKVQAKDGSLQLRVDEDHFVTAVETLRQHGYPRKKFVSAEDFFPAGQLISSPVQEKTRISYLKEQSLERMLSNIEGVIAANVSIGQEAAESGLDTAPDPSVAVLVKYSPEVNLKAFSVQIRKLVLSAVPGVKDESVALMLQPVSQRSLPEAPEVLGYAGHEKPTDVAESSGHAKHWILAGIAAGAGILVMGGLACIYRRHHRAESYHAE